MTDPGQSAFRQWMQSVMQSSYGPAGCFIGLVALVLVTATLIWLAFVRDDGGTPAGSSPEATPTTVVATSTLPPDSSTTTPETTDDAPLVPRAGRWTITDGAGTSDCGGIVVDVPPGAPITGDLEVLEGGARIYFDSPDPSAADIEAELIEATADMATYEGALAADALGEGVSSADTEDVDLVFTIAFDSPEHGVTHVGGSIGQEGVACTVDRPGDAVYAGS